MSSVVQAVDWSTVTIGYAGGRCGRHLTIHHRGAVELLLLLVVNSLFFPVSCVGDTLAVAIVTALGSL